MSEVAGHFDVDFYRATYKDLIDSSDNLLEHFCQEGWKLLYKPNADFDIWWYWANHLDPSSDEVNPLLHYVREGRAAGLSTKPTPSSVRQGSALPTDRPLRRACLFAGFDGQGFIDESVLAYIRELSRFADVFCLFDNYLPTGEMAKLAGVATQVLGIQT